MSAQKTIIIAGGGGAGAKLARALSEKIDAAKYNLILISSHPTYLHYPAMLRVLVNDEGKLEERALMPYDKVFVNGNGTFKQGTITSIKAEKNSKSGGEVVLESGETISYDILALSPGSHWEDMLAFPSAAAQERAHIDEWRKKFKDANKVVIAGGGAVGIELAGEIKDVYPTKQVTIVHADKHLLNGTYPEKFRVTLEKQMRARNIKLILDDYVDSIPATTTRKGVSLDADLIVSARGPRPNTEFIAASLGPDTITSRGFVKIKPTLQLDSYSNVFALGDIIDYPEQKQVGKYAGHVKIVLANILSQLNGVEPTKPYKGTPEIIVVTNGKKGGAGYFNILWGISIGNGLSSTLKSKDLFVSMTRKNMGYTS